MEIYLYNSLSPRESRMVSQRAPSRHTRSQGDNSAKPPTLKTKWVSIPNKIEYIQQNIISKDLLNRSPSILFTITTAFFRCSSLPWLKLPEGLASRRQGQRRVIPWVIVGDVFHASDFVRIEVFLL